MDDSSSTATLTREVLDRIESDAPPSERESLLAFAESFLRRLPPEFASMDSEDAYRQVRGLLEFISVRTDPFAVRVFNPTRETHGYDPGCTVVEVVSVDGPFLIDSVTNELLAAGVEV
ncbi:MAG: NAD-glutamate dehydrogenase, partial [Acidimicrobiia bacterium]|nr:NAD-glutamate dehydrogenase [Acidimicrobiia bacterium]